MSPKPGGWRPANSTERGKASILEAKANLTAAESEWLQRYRAAHPPRKAKSSSSTSSSSSSSTTPVSEVRELEPTKPAEPPPAEELVDVDLDDDDDDDEPVEGRRGPNEPSELTTTSSAIECDIPDCSACRTMRGAMICKVTGRATYPRLSEEGADMLAGLGTGAVHLFARTTRPDHYAPRPTPGERARMAKGVKMVADRRFPQAGAIDDVLVLLHAFYVYGHRAMLEAKPAETKPSTSTSTSSPASEPSTSSSSSAPTPTPPAPPPAPSRPTTPENDDADFDERAIELELSRAPAVH